MKTNKPYLSLTKNTSKYELGVIITAVKDQTIIGIRQEEVKKAKILIGELSLPSPIQSNWLMDPKTLFFLRL